MHDHRFTFLEGTKGACSLYPTPGPISSDRPLTGPRQPSVSWKCMQCASDREVVCQLVLVDSDLPSLPGELQDRAFRFGIGHAVRYQSP